MNLREVTIGRSSNCDIYLDQKCVYASGVHGRIYYDGSQLMYQDNSTNGTLINNVSVRKRAVPIKRGDVIMIAGKYMLPWNQIDSFFPDSPLMMSNKTGIFQEAPSLQGSVQQPSHSEQPANLGRWSWGAFVLTWIWGIFNGCWWILLIEFGILFFSAITIWIPFVGFFSVILGIGKSVLYGVKGTEWAWRNRTWQSVADFEQTQATWNKVGLIIFIIGLILSVLSCVIGFATLAAYL